MQPNLTSKLGHLTAEQFVALASLSNPEPLIDPRLLSTDPLASDAENMGGRGLPAQFWGNPEVSVSAYQTQVGYLSTSTLPSVSSVLGLISTYPPAAVGPTPPENLLRPLIKQASNDDLATLAHGLYRHYDALVADDKRIGDETRSDSMYSIISDIWSELTKRYASNNDLNLSHILINFCQTFQKIPVADDAVDGERQLADLILNAAEGRLTTLLAVLATKIAADKELGLETGIRNLVTTIEQAKQRIPANADVETKRHLENCLESILQKAFDSSSLQ